MTASVSCSVQISCGRTKMYLSPGEPRTVYAGAMQLSSPGGRKCPGSPAKQDFSPG